jgi:CubicO group peptidase (beta-lactamase class C family)
MRARAILLAVLVALTVAPYPSSAQTDTQTQAATIKDIAQQSMQRYHLKALIVRVTYGGRNVYTGAFGESMTGVPATPAMHFRNGAMAFTYISTLLMELVDQKRLSLDDKLSKFMPDLPSADKITLKNLANMTSGYADYVYTPEVIDGVLLTPFRQWTPDELMQIGISKPMMFAPGSNWGYCHTNYAILGRVLAKVTGMTLASALKRYVLVPMHLTQTQSFDTPEIPAPVLHTFSSERRENLHIPASTPFYEESTFWNPSWTTPGAVQITDITDMTTTMEFVGTGRLLSKASFAAQVQPHLIGFGHHVPNCAACRQNTTALNYGLGVVDIGPWITQTKSFAGSGGTVGYLPSKKLAIAVVTTSAPTAFDAQGNSTNESGAIFTELGNALVPNSVPTIGK